MLPSSLFMKPTTETFHSLPSVFFVLLITVFLAGCGGGKPDQSQQSGGHDSSPESDSAPPTSDKWMEYRFMRLGSNAEMHVRRPLDAGRVPMVIMAHHFDTVLPNAYHLLGERLIEQGIASILVYYNKETEMNEEGLGVNVEYEKTLSLAQDIREIILHADGRQRRFVDLDRVGIVGFRLGGTVAICAQEPLKHSIEDFPGFAAVALWSPAISFRQGVEELFGQDAGESLAIGEKLGVNFQERRVLLHLTFFESLDDLKPELEIAKLHCPILGITGAESPDALSDLRELVSNVDAQDASVDTLIIENTDWRLGLQAPETPFPPKVNPEDLPEPTRQLVEATADFFVRSLLPGESLTQVTTE